ncbi:MAG: hypothetical protein J6W06_05805 [Bacteroidales bacterium]|nr:hypothetical protein [Bacteroidales bacterium]
MHKEELIGNGGFSFLGFAVSMPVAFLATLFLGFRFQWLRRLNACGVSVFQVQEFYV